MYDPRSDYNKDLTVKFRKSEVQLALGCGYNPDESKIRGIFKIRLTTPYLKYDGSWYHIKCSWKWSYLTDIADYIKSEVYTEEQFLAKLINLIEDD